MTSSASFYEAGTVEQVAINLFYGWGYNFYRLENQLRADDLLVRAKVSEILGSTRSGVEAAESAYRREFLQPPSRERPRPDPDAVRGAQLLEALGREIGALAGRIRALPVPENDRMTQRHRLEAETLARLAKADETMVGRAEVLRTLLARATGAWMLANVEQIREGISWITAAVEARREILAV